MYIMRSKTPIFFQVYVNFPHSAEKRARTYLVIKPKSDFKPKYSELNMKNSTLSLRITGFFRQYSQKNPRILIQIVALEVRKKCQRFPDIIPKQIREFTNDTFVPMRNNCEKMLPQKGQKPHNQFALRKRNQNKDKKIKCAIEQ